MNQLLEQAKENKRLLVAATAILIPAAIIVLAIFRIRAADPVETIAVNWTASAHANYTSQSFTYWHEDNPPLIPADCAACHSLHGVLDRVGERGTPAGSVSQDMPIGTVVSCVACHNDTVHQMNRVEFPSGEVVDALGSEAACLLCHQGTSSSDEVNQAISGLDDDAVDDSLEFINVHYHIAAATLMGTTARVGYQYPGQSYVGRFDHTPDFQTCDSCHNPHDLAINPLECSACHVHVTDRADLRLIRNDPRDYNGDGDTDQGIAVEINTFHVSLYEALQAYADDVIGTPLVYSADDFPYFFVDVSDNGQVDTAVFNFDNRYTEWTPRLVRAAYNYHFVQKDPGAFSHNPSYVLQLLYDSLVDLNERVPVDVNRFQRPP
ncbi:MAG: polyheme membrane-associated cytochrome C [Chloroflexota bacterium]|jgi:hypothetical protein